MSFFEAGCLQYGALRKNAKYGCLLVAYEMGVRSFTVYLDHVRQSLTHVYQHFFFQGYEWRMKSGAGL